VTRGSLPRGVWAAYLAGVTVLAGCGLIRAPGSTWGAPAIGSAASQQAAAPQSTQQQAAPSAHASHPVASVSALEDPHGKFLGVEASGAPDTMNPVSSFAASVGITPNLIGQYVAWGAPFDALAASNAVSSGALYYVVWEPFKPTVAAIADGASDAYVTTFAQAVRAFGSPVALSFGHEMNGNWYPWGTTGTTPADFTAAWRHIHDLFKQAGATNVIWVWNPNIINPVPDVRLEPFWPGSSYVDWVGLTGYFGVSGAHTFDGAYGPTMTEVRQFASKPFIIAETSVETSGEQLSSIASLISGVRSNGDMLGFIWFDYVKAGVDWTVEGRPQVRAEVASQLAGMPLASPGS
jgi:mannan endo-1,4-beta-mannosidase